MDDFTVGAIVFSLFVGLLIIGAQIGAYNRTHNDVLKQVGIDCIVKCNNASSNWYEIVWSDKKE